MSEQPEPDPEVTEPFRFEVTEPGYEQIQHSDDRSWQMRTHEEHPPEQD